MSELELLRREYESSLSWRVTRPLRALRRRTRARPSSPPVLYDSWLEAAHGEELRAIDDACAGAGPEAYGLFRDLDSDLWALLLTGDYEGFPNIRAFLPDVPDPSLQRLWNGASGVALAAQGVAFYTKLLDRFRRHGDRPLHEARVLDFGCGWGRLTRFLARDVAPGHLYGCDPVQQILDVCRSTRVPATFARTDFSPERLAFDEPFELAYAFSVFTHLSESAHERCLGALHEALRPGGVLVVTVRPPAYARLCEGMRPPLDGPDYLFVPHPAEASHPQYAGGEMTYGETVITVPYIRENWTSRFELLDVDVLTGDLYQLIVTLRRR
jgi:SAM-dependent methyltransferase